MDSLFNQFDMLDQEAASGLLTLSELEEDKQETTETPSRVKARAALVLLR